MITHRVTMPSPHGLAITPDGKEVLAAVFGASSVAFVDTTTDAVLGRATCQASGLGLP